MLSRGTLFHCLVSANALLKRRIPFDGTPAKNLMYCVRLVELVSFTYPARRCRTTQDSFLHRKTKLTRFTKNGGEENVSQQIALFRDDVGRHRRCRTDSLWRQRRANASARAADRRARTSDHRTRAADRRARTSDHRTLAADRRSRRRRCGIALCALGFGAAAR